jgi:hypothetical protein
MHVGTTEVHPATSTMLLNRALPYAVILSLVALRWCGLKYGPPDFTRLLYHSCWSEFDCGPVS